MSFYVLPNMPGTFMPHLASMPRITAPKLSSPFPNIRIAFEIKEEIKGKSLLIWESLISSFKLNFKCEKQVVSLEFFLIKEEKFKKNVDSIQFSKWFLFPPAHTDKPLSTYSTMRPRKQKPQWVN